MCMWMDGSSAEGQIVVSRAPLYQLCDSPVCQGQGALLLLLGQRTKTFLTGQRANALLPAIWDDGIGGAWRERGDRNVKGRDMEVRYLAQLWQCPYLFLFLHPSCPPPPSSFSGLNKLADRQGWAQGFSFGIVSILFLPYTASWSLSSIHHSLGFLGLIVRTVGPFPSCPSLLLLTGPPGAIQSPVSCCGWRWFTGGPSICFPFPCGWFC